MTIPTTVYTILQKDRQGKPRGFEKGDGVYYMDKESADLAQADDTLARVASFTVVECVIMSKEWYDQLVQQKMV
jgi:hypothetical protein